MYNQFSQFFLIPTLAGDLNGIFVSLFSRQFQQCVGCLWFGVMCGSRSGRRTANRTHVFVGRWRGDCERVCVLWHAARETEEG